MVEKTEIESRFRRSMESYDENAYVQKVIIKRLVVLLEEYCSRPAGQILEIGCGTGLLTEEIQSMYDCNRLIINDLVEAMCSRTASRCRLSQSCCIPGDIETIGLEGEFGLIVSSSTFQWLAHPEQTFARLSGHLQKGGWLIFSTFGEDNFKELKNITGSGLVYHSAGEMKGLLAPYFEILHTEESRCILEFDDPVEILRHAKKTGVNASGGRQNWTRGHLEKFAAEYTVRYLSEDGYPLTYHPMYFVCRRL